MQSETQKNWNEYFNQKKKRNINPIIIIICLLFVTTAAFVYFNPMNLKKSDISRAFRDITGVHDPYVAGDFMDAMIQQVDSIESGNYEYLDQLLTYDSKEVDPDFLNEWNNYLIESQNTLDEMKYHSSYSEFIAACYKILDESKLLINLASSEKPFDSIGNSEVSDCIDQIYNSSDLMNDELMKAFDKNGIDYYEDEDYINYYYE
jgi:hypothetical protein